MEANVEEFIEVASKGHERPRLKHERLVGKDKQNVAPPLSLDSILLALVHDADRSRVDTDLANRQCPSSRVQDFY